MWLLLWLIFLSLPPFAVLFTDLGRADSAVSQSDRPGFCGIWLQ